ncbi:SET methyltransferase domain containing protein [Nitzschia inconspicua]|uniref:SET methyltransferase domain containing protein n=1 Tax=Nitzschia inconspicua TaxID=303405 RepID=A0A9K3LJJ6_9STRA|nr:SET methyltransferase domain containing protein [Nitzschia inconspicua]
MAKKRRLSNRQDKDKNDVGSARKKSASTSSRVSKSPPLSLSPPSKEAATITTVKTPDGSLKRAFTPKSLSSLPPTTEKILTKPGPSSQITGDEIVMHHQPKHELNITEKQRLFLNAVTGPRKNFGTNHETLRIPSFPPIDITPKDPYPMLPQKYVPMIKFSTRMVARNERIVPKSEDSGKTFNDEENNHEMSDLTPSYSSVAVSFLKLFCNQCNTFDCPLHSISSKDVAVEAAVALEYDKSEEALTYTELAEMETDSSYTLPSPDNDSFIEDDNFSSNTEETATSVEMKVILARMKMICGDDTQLLSAITGGRYSSTLATLDEEQKDGKFITPLAHTAFKSEHLKQDKLNRKRRISKRMETLVGMKAIERSFFRPCSHPDRCSRAANCSCVAGNLICTKQCIWGKFGDNLYPGCKCPKSSCTMEQCRCFMANRECDPDVCGCKCCKNNNMTSSKKKRQLFISKSTVANAGLGLFTKSPLAKGDFLGEYIGEYILTRPVNSLLGNGEDVRAQDKLVNEGIPVAPIDCIREDLHYGSSQPKESPYGFDMTKDLAVDAINIGNKVRYINYSDNPNVEAIHYAVNGETRLGIYAMCKIPAQAELFIDYGPKYPYTTYGISATKYSIQNGGEN